MATDIVGALGGGSGNKYAAVSVRSCGFTKSTRGRRVSTAKPRLLVRRFLPMARLKAVCRRYNQS